MMKLKGINCFTLDIPIYAVVEDICASGGYYIAVAADQIFVNKASIVGSIGVRMDGFGLGRINKEYWCRASFVNSR